MTPQPDDLLSLLRRVQASMHDQIAAIKSDAEASLTIAAEQEDKINRFTEQVNRLTEELKQTDQSIQEKLSETVKILGEFARLMKALNSGIAVSSHLAALALDYSNKVYAASLLISVTAEDNEEKAAYLSWFSRVQALYKDVALKIAQARDEKARHDASALLSTGMMDLAEELKGIQSAK